MAAAGCLRSGVGAVSFMFQDPKVVFLLELGSQGPSSERPTSFIKPPVWIFSWVIHSMFSLSLRIRQCQTLKGAERLLNPTTLVYRWGNKGQRDHYLPKVVYQVCGRVRTRSLKNSSVPRPENFPRMSLLSSMHPYLVLRVRWSPDSEKRCPWQTGHWTSRCGSAQTF